MSKGTRQLRLRGEVSVRMTPNGWTWRVKTHGFLSATCGSERFGRKEDALSQGQAVVNAILRWEHRMERKR